MMTSSSVPVRDFVSGRGWQDSTQSESRARWCCEQLEESRILLFENLPFDLPAADREFLLGRRLGDSRFHKNISYRPVTDVLRGFADNDPAAGQRMHEIMRRYSQTVIKFLSQLLAPYAKQWSLDYASFRPEAEESRNLPLRKRNDLLHVDAFPSRPTRGGRILRCFTNVNPTQARVWCTTDKFPELAQAHAQDAGLARFARNGKAPYEPLLQAVQRALGLKTSVQSRYDKFMLHFHDYLKENAAFQKDCPKERIEFQPGTTWICFTDSVPHAVLQGQFAMEQTLIIPMSAMVLPQKAPLRILETLAGVPLNA